MSDSLEPVRDRIRRLLDAWPGPKLAPGVPVSLRDPNEPGDLNGWASWRFVPSTVDVDALLREPLPGVLPPSYVAFLTTYACLDIDFGDYTLPAMPPEAPLAHLRQLWADTSMHTAGYLAIGSARRCGDPICLDLRRRDERGETPVVLFNHDFVPRAAWARRGVLLPFAAELAPTFEALLRGLTEDDPHLFPPPLSLAEKRRMT